MLIKNFYLKLIIFMVINAVITIGEECENLSAVCREESNCRECIRKHHCCVWCYDERFNGTQRCNIQNAPEFSTCDSSLIEHNVKTEAKITQNVSFTDVESDTTKAIQLSPREFKINLRYGEPVNITVQYRPAKNYPFDLYYLMDLTKSMQPDLETLKNLGSKLAEKLKKLTKNHYIAFGSYIDKPEMPFYNTAPEYRENPCKEALETCDKGYVFKHRLNFTENVDMFTSEVGKSGISANYDNLEGGIDALMQVMLCGKTLGWSDNSRKLVLIATEGLMHFAGDGLLAGYIQRNRGSCLVDTKGTYRSSEHYDYPSLEEVHRQLKNKKINLIVAAKKSVLSYYKKMSEVLKENVFVGELDKDSTNVLNLVEDGYYAFMRRVNLFVNSSEVKEVEVKFFADCDGNGRWTEKSYCNNAEEGKIITFKAQFQLNDYRTGKTTLFIEESNIYEKISVDVNFVGSNCDCHLHPPMTDKCVHGEVSCGDCICDVGWSGQYCMTECKNDISMCRLTNDDDVSLTCYGRGDCICSKCQCEFPYDGQYCEFVCPHNQRTRQKCGGHGICVEGVCQCEPNYTDTDCSCYQSTSDCEIPGSDHHCSGHGNCTCNKCVCESGYSGKYCDYSKQLATHSLCNKYEKIVFEHVEERKSNNENSTVKVEIVEVLPEDERSCVFRYDREDGSKCDIFYKYLVKPGRVDIKATEPICNSPVRARILALWIVLSFLVLGFFIVLLWKLRNMYRDRKEYQLFVEEQNRTRHTEQNPIYKNPLVTYQNPGRVRIHSKDD